MVDDPPPQIAFPYVRIASVDFSPNDGGLALGGDVTLGLMVHSRPAAGGRVEAQGICEAIYSALHRRLDLVFEGFHLVEIEVAVARVDRESDGASYLGRVVVQLRLDGAIN